MKSRRLTIVILAVAAVVLVAACKKSRYCHCVSDNYTIVINSDTVTRADSAIVNVDRGLDCESIKQMNFRTRDEGNVIYTDRKVTCVELNYDTMYALP
ncbi:MAG: hypothetical protein IJM81_02345 [Prevotella sp.]|nr:hypothetical protein [Prevotella sp.]MBQ6956109.1 hypothetical protein [Bacteroidales bacterium]